MSKARVLFVDDEPNVLSAIRRTLRNDFDVHTAESGKEALRILEEAAPFGVIVSDCRMPEMDGIEFLQRCSRSSPLAVRVMLTGNMDQDTAVKAVNVGDVFKFLNKPCQGDELKSVVAQAMRQHELVVAEKELLEQTLKASIKVLADLLGIAKPEAFGRTDRLRRKARDVAAHVAGVSAWELDTATLLSQLGCVNVAPEVLTKVQLGEDLNDREMQDYTSHPKLGAELIGGIPRLGRVAKIVLYQNKSFDGTGFPSDDVKKDQIPLEARILHGVLAYDGYFQKGWTAAQIVEVLRKTPGAVDPAIVAALKACSEVKGTDEMVRVPPAEMRLGMLVQEDVRMDNGLMLICRGQEVTRAIREHLVKFQKSGTLTKRILCAQPALEPTSEATA